MAITASFARAKVSFRSFGAQLFRRFGRYGRFLGLPSTIVLGRVSRNCCVRLTFQTTCILYAKEIVFFRLR